MREHVTVFMLRRSDVYESMVLEVAPATDGWWAELDHELIACIGKGPTSAEKLARRMGVSEAALTSLLLMLAAQGKVRIRTVELVETEQV